MSQPQHEYVPGGRYLHVLENDVDLAHLKFEFVSSIWSDLATAAYDYLPGNAT